MKTKYYLILSVITFCQLVSCSNDAGQTKSPWHSSKMRQIQKEYYSLCNSLGATLTKKDYEIQQRKIEELLNKDLSHEEMRELAATCDELPVDENDWSDFQRDFMQNMFGFFLKRGDRDSLVKLFSMRYSSRHDLLETEYILVLQGEKIKDPILILGDAYTKCETPEVRQAIAQAIRHAFVGSEIRGNNDAEIITNAMRWYAEEKDRLVLNQKYPAYSSFHRYSKDPLFIKKDTDASQQDEHQTGKESKSSARPTATQVGVAKTVTNSIGMKLALVPTGTFVMGSPPREDGKFENEEPQHPVRITKPFWMGVCEVTQEEYQRVMGKNPSFYSSDFEAIARIPGLNPKRLPVDSVTWYDAVEFCNRLSKKEGLPAYYSLSDEDRDHWRTVKMLGGTG